MSGGKDGIDVHSRSRGRGVHGSLTQRECQPAVIKAVNSQSACAIGRAATGAARLNPRALAAAAAAAAAVAGVADSKWPLTHRCR